MKIYFAASIRGGLNDRELYAQIIDALRGYGTVLTEHIVAGSTSRLGSIGTVQDIYAQDMGWLKGSDVMVAEVTQPSLGVGYEIAYAEQLHKPILCLYRPTKDKSLSAMIAGSPFTEVTQYQTIDQVKAILRDYFEK